MRSLVRRTITKKKDSGFTFLEVMVAVALLAIALIAVLGSQSQSVSLASEARFYTTVTLLAQGKMAEIEAKDLDTLSSDSGDFGEDFPNYSWNLKVSDVEIPGEEEAYEHLRQIDLIVSWGQHELYQYHLRLYRFVPETP